LVVRHPLTSVQIGIFKVRIEECRWSPHREVLRVAAVSACLSFECFAGSAGDAPWWSSGGGVEVEIVFSKVAGIDVHKRQVTVAIRVPDDVCNSGGEARAQKVRRFATFYGALLEMAECFVPNRLRT
jgi:hypothetical protein